jgi:glucose/arabinose dehydrogenase
MESMRAAQVVKRFAAPVLAAAALATPAAAGAFVTLVPAWSNSASVSQPVFVTAPPGDSHRLFVVTKPGVVYAVVDGVLKSTPFLDISSRVWNQGEGGLLSIAFDPADTNRFYAYFVATPTGLSANGAIRIEEFTRTNPDLADQTVGRLVLEIPHPDASNHYGGTIEFGPNDGLLYIAPGDGGGQDDQFGNAQSKKSLLGKLLRIDPHESASAPYTVPGAATPLCNPPSGTTDCPEVLALGLRNPFRWSFDRQTGDIAIGDVGQDQWEEVDYVPASKSLAGLNFGWPCFEAFAANVTCAPFARTDPVFAYADPVSGPVAITGGVVVRDPALTTLLGRYVYADVYAGRVRSLLLGTLSATDDRLESDIPKVSQVVAFGEDAAAHVYVVSLAGAVSRIVCSGPCSERPPGPPVAGGDPPAAPAQVPDQTPPPADQQPPVARDSAPPTLDVRAARIQNVARRGRVRLSVAAGESAIVRISARAHGLALSGALVRLAPGRRVVVELRASTRLRRLLARRGVVAVELRARDAAGNLRVAALRITARGR